MTSCGILYATFSLAAPIWSSVTSSPVMSTASAEILVSSIWRTPVPLMAAILIYACGALPGVTAMSSIVRVRVGRSKAILP